MVFRKYMLNRDSVAYLMIDSMVFNVVFNIFSYIAATSAPIHTFFDIFSTTQHNILSKPLAAFPQNNCPNKMLCFERGSLSQIPSANSEVKSAELRIDPATSCSQVFYATD